MTAYPPQDEVHFPAGRYVLAYSDDVPQGSVAFLERWESGRPVVRGVTETFPLNLSVVRMASSHGTYAKAQKVRLASCSEEHMTDGEVMNRVAEYERELPWAPSTDNAEAHRAWYARTAGKRAAAERADAELKSRGIDLANAPKITAAEYLREARRRESAD
jgi:hypothetical protein